MRLAEAEARAIAVRFVEVNAREHPQESEVKRPLRIVAITPHPTERGQWLAIFKPDIGVGCTVDGAESFVNVDDVTGEANFSE